MRSITLLMNKQLRIFFDFVELRTKIASVIPMTAGILWSIYRYKQFNLLTTVIFILAVLSFDMCTTAINNTMDYIKAKNEHYKHNENVIGIHQLTLKKMIYVVLGLLAFAIVMSLILVALTDIVLLAIGAICFAIGILYTFGPVPISRTPYGEVFSGVTMGFGIYFIAVFIQSPQTLLATQWLQNTVQVNWYWKTTLEIFMMSLPFICLIANIMLANNTCDLETDITNERHTLVYYIGTYRAVRLYQLLSLLPWIFWGLYMVLGLLPLWAGIGFIGIYPHYLSVQRFSSKQVKRETFVEAIKSFKLFAAIYLVVLIIAIILSWFG
ncbi:1,4-dihydroxy-2-naphthoate polyprenyltransferase [Aerococcaceae bacterium zg-BR33]|nr:1,4-dihydroxy-2-naphthoate polyprenyltransferase [Aerococcaceae bacterium zg-A91]MBS4457192.1 1,4-dihydroxy-2-naphthoate polyprenyltransferase [Aerococcaceae bacterium zg-BR33]